MAHHFIKQPNGLYAIWSTVIDDFLLTDATPEEVVEYQIAQVIENERSEMERILKRLENNEPCGWHTWDELIKIYGNKIK